MNKTLFLRNKKFRYGTVSVVLTAVFIALVVIVNAIFSSLAYKLNWYVDMSPEEFYTLGDASKALLSDVEADVNIIFCMDPDELEEIQAMRYIFTTAKQLREEFPNITITHKDPEKNPSFFQKYKITGTNINDYTVIVESGTEYRVFTWSAFYKISTNTGNPFAYDGEFKFTSAILAITQTESPIVCFTKNHGEDPNLYLIELLIDAGYDFRAIDLTTEDIPEDCRLVVINNPQTDFITTNDGSDISEIEKIDRFLDKFGSLMVFMSPDVKELPDLEEYLEEWGIKFERSLVRDVSNSVSIDGFSLVASYPTEGYGASIHADLRNLAQPPKTIVKYAMPIKTLFDENGDYFLNNIERNISPVLTSSAKAIAMQNGEQISSATDIDKYNLMTFTYEKTLIDNDPYFSYVLACGSANFADQAYVTSNTYANRDILYSALRAMGKDKVPVDIDYKILTDTSIEDITTAEATGWTWGLTLVLPLLSLLAGFVVVIRRRHS